MDSINLLVISGTLERVNIRYRDDGTPICSGSLRVEELGAQGTVFRTYVPLEGYGKVAETLGECQAGDIVMLQGKVFWRKFVTKAGEEKSGLAVLVAKSSVLLAMATATSTAKE